MLVGLNIIAICSKSRKKEDGQEKRNILIQTLKHRCTEEHGL